MAQLELHIRIVPWVLDHAVPHVDSPYPAFRRSAAAGCHRLPREAMEAILAVTEL